MAEKIPDTIPQIGPATLAILRQRRITTNLHVLYTNFPKGLRPFGDTDSSLALKSVPGIGPGKEALLREWAKRIPLTVDEKIQLKQEGVRLKAERAQLQAEEDARLAQRQAEEDARLAQRQAEEDARLAKQKAKEDAQRARSERAIRLRLGFTRIVFGGTIVGFVYLFILMKENLGFLFSIIFAGIVSGLLGGLVLIAGYSIFLNLD